MPRVPRPDELPRSTLAGASTPAQINIGVAGAIGAAGRAQGQAIAAIGNAFGEVVGRIGQANDANAFADAKLEWLKGDMSIQDDISRNVGEDGALWQSTGDRYAGLNKQIDSKFNISDPQKRRDFERWRDMQTFERGMGAAKQYQGAQRGLFLKGFDADVAGVEERLQKGEIDPATFNEYYSTLSEKLGSMAGKTINQVDADAKTKELQGRLTGALDRYLASKAPGERAAFWDQVSKGQYEVDQPLAIGPISQQFFDRTPSPEERRKIAASGGIVVNLDTNWAESDQQTTPMVVIPDNATPAQRAAAEAYARGIADTYKQQFGKSLEPKVVTTSENGRGRAHTIHTEPFSVNDSKAVKYFTSPEGRAAHARLLAETFGKVPGAHLSIPHDPDGPRKDRGAKGAYGDEVDLAKQLIAELRQSGSQPQLVSGPTKVVPKGVQVADASGQVPASAVPANDNRTVSASTATTEPAAQPLVDPAVMGQLSQADGKQLATDVISMEVLSDLADKSDAVASVENLETMTVDDLRKIVAEHEVKGLNARAAGGVPAKVIPEGRLLPGQTFSVKTPKGEFKVPSEWINSLTPKMRAEYARQAQRDNAVYQRQLKADADEMMKNQEAHVAEFGKNAPDYDVRAVQAAYGTDPKKLKAHAQRLRVGKAIYDEFRDAASLPDDEIVARLERIRPEMDGVHFAEAKEIYEKAEKRLDLLMKERARDPAGAVEKSKDVMSVREKLIGGTPRNKYDWQALMMARLDAQRRLDIAEEARSPLTGNELRALAAPLRGVEPEQAAERIEQVHASVKEKYGEKFSGVIMRKVVETTVKDKERRQSFGAMLTELEEEEKISPTTLRMMREREALAGQEKQLAPKPQAAAPTYYSRVMGMMPGMSANNVFSGNYKMGLENMPRDAGPTGPRRTPPREAVDMLKANPGSMRQFEATFGLSPGEGRKYLLKE